MPSHHGGEEDPWLGRELAEQVEVRELIGIGAMGRVYRGHQRGIERPVAVKVLHADLMHRPGVMERFHREARVASRLNHPNVVQVLMTGEVMWRSPSPDGGGPSTRQGGGRSGEGSAGSERESPSVQRAAYLVMEYLDGDSLASILENHGGPLRLERALHIALQVCDAVGEAHDQGIVHRDLKPENVMLVRRGGDPDFVKVLDFGVAKVDWLDGAQATQVGTVFGTARYMAPEAARGELVTPRSDVYSIATLLYQCLAGRTPFDGTNTVAVLVKQCSEAPLELSTIAPQVPAPVARVVHRNLSKTPGERCSTARELGAALLAAAREAHVEGFAAAARPTLQGLDAPVFDSPPLRASGAPRPSPSGAPAETTLIDPDLAGTPAGAHPQRMRQGRSTELTDDGGRAPVVTHLEPHGARSVYTSFQPDEPARVTRAPAPWNQGRATHVGEGFTAPAGTRLGPDPAFTEGVHPTPPPATPPPARAGYSLPPASPTGFSSPPPFQPPGPPTPLWTADGAPPSAPRRPRRWRRRARWALGLTLATALAAGGAFFAARALLPQEDGLASWIDRANAALALGVWHADDGQGFVEITDAALARYPDAPELIDLRERGARRMAREARRLEHVERERAIELARWAARLSPDDDAVQKVTTTLLAPEPATVTADLPAEDASTETDEATPEGEEAEDPAGAATTTPAVAKPAAPSPAAPVARVPGPLPKPAGPTAPSGVKPAAAPAGQRPAPAPLPRPQGTAQSPKPTPSTAKPPDDSGKNTSPEKPRERWL